MLSSHSTQTSLMGHPFRPFEQHVPTDTRAHAPQRRRAISKFGRRVLRRHATSTAQVRQGRRHA